MRLDIFTGDLRKRWLPGKKSLKSELIASYPRLSFFFAAFDFLSIALRSSNRHSGVLVLVEHYGPAGWLYSKWKGIPCIIVQCGTYSVKLPHDIPFFRHVLQNSSRILPISHYTRKRMEEEGIKANYSVIPLGVNVDMFRKNTGIQRRPEVVFVGNLKARKGFDFLLNAMAIAIRSIPEASLKVIGNIDRGSPSFRSASLKISELGVVVDFAGQLSDEQLIMAYAGARLNVLPSKSDRFYFEGFGLIHLEANACGTLTVGTFDSGNEDAVKDGFGSLVRYGDVDALAQKIIEALSVEPYPDLPIQEIRTWDDVARDYIEVFHQVLNSNHEKPEIKKATQTLNSR